MNDSNLVSLRERTPEERREIAHLGGSVCSPAKKLAAKVRSARWTSDRKQAAMGVVDCIVDAELNAVEILRYAEQIKQDPNLTVDGHLKLLQTVIRAHEAIHGSKHKVEAQIGPTRPTFNISALIDEERKNHPLVFEDEKIDEVKIYR